MLKKQHQNTWSQITVVITSEKNSKSIIYNQNGHQKKDTEPIKLGRISEIFTSIITYQLANENSGTFSLDKPINRYTKKIEIKEPEFNMRFITVKDLLSHTSGIGEFRQVWDYYKYRDGYFSSTKSTISLLKSFYESSIIEQNFSPNNQWYPSPHNYGLLGYILEEISGNDYENLLNNHLLDPLQLTQTGISYQGTCGQSSLLPSSDGIVSSISDVMSLMNEIIRGYNDEESKIDPNICRAIFEPKYQPNKKLNAVASPFVILPEENVWAELSSFQAGIYNKIVFLPKDKVGIFVSIIGIDETRAETIVSDILKIVNTKYVPISSKKKFPDIDVKIKFDETELFRAGKQNKLLAYYFHNFGNTVRLEKTKGRYVIRNPWNHLGYYRSNSKLRPKEIIPYDQDKLGYYFYFQSGGKIQRLFLPKTPNLLYIMIEYPAPIRLYRSRKKRFKRFSSAYSYYSEKIFIFGFYPRLSEVIKDIKPASKYVLFNIKNWLARIFNYSKKFVKYLVMKAIYIVNKGSSYRVSHLRYSWFEIDRLLEINNEKLRDNSKRYKMKFLDTWGETTVFINDRRKIVTTSVTANFRTQLSIFWEKISFRFPKTIGKVFQLLETVLLDMRRRRTIITSEKRKK